MFGRVFVGPGGMMPNLGRDRGVNKVVVHIYKQPVPKRISSIYKQLSHLLL